MIPLRKLASQLSDLATEQEAGHPIDTFELRVIARRLVEQSHQLEQEKAE